MLLKEFFYFNDQQNDFAVDRRYFNDRDQSVVEKEDTRKLRLTFRDINMLRQQSEAHEFEEQSESEFVRQMYGIPPEAAQVPE